MNTHEHLPEWAYEVAPCLKDSPYADAARTYVAAALALEKSPSNDLLKIITSFNIVHAKRHVEEQPDIDPTPYFSDSLIANAKLLEAGAKADCGIVYDTQKKDPVNSRDEKTAHHYGNLFSAFSKEDYLEEPLLLLRQRLERNGYLLEKLPEWRALDAGCGNGRYTVAMRNLGFKSVEGIDLSQINIDDAKRRLAEIDVDGVNYQQASALELPFADGEFDFVFSNGVLHHTPDCAKGVNEVLRVLKPGSCGFLKLVGRPGGLHWDHCEILRAALHDIEHSAAREVYVQLGVPANLCYLFLDHVFAPINILYTREEVRKMLEDAGAINIKWLERGADFDLTERTYQGEPYADVKYADGEHRFYFEKP